MAFNLPVRFIHRFVAGEVHSHSFRPNIRMVDRMCRGNVFLAGGDIYLSLLSICS